MRKTTQCEKCGLEIVNNNGNVGPNVTEWVKACKEVEAVKAAVPAFCPYRQAALAKIST